MGPVIDRSHFVLGRLRPNLGSVIVLGTTESVGQTPSPNLNKNKPEITSYHPSSLRIHQKPTKTKNQKLIRSPAKLKIHLLLSFKLFNQLGRVEEAEFDGFTYSFVLNACAKLGFLREREQVHGRILCKGVCSNVFVQTNLVNMYALSGGDDGVVKARRVFDEMTERSVVTWNTMLAGYLRCGFVNEARKVFDDMPERNGVSWTTMITSFAHNGKCKQALALFCNMWRVGVQVGGVALVAALSACAELGDLKTGSWIHSFVDKNLRFRNQPRPVSLNNALIHMYASCGLIDEAYGVFNEMRCRSVVSWTTMITGLAKQGDGDEALGVFRWMQNEGDNQVRPNERTFLGVLCACSHSGMVE